jgi:hypothetical protein
VPELGDERDPKIDEIFMAKSEILRMAQKIRNEKIAPF